MTNILTRIKMKTILLGLLILIGFNAQSQDYTMEVKGQVGETWVKINNLFADIKIEGISGSEIKIEARGYEGLPEKAKGLKPLSASGPENTGIGLSIQQDGNEISISGAHREADDAEYTIRLPKNLKLGIDYNSWQAGDVKIEGMAGEVEAKSQVGDLEFIDVTGPIVAHTLSSDLIVTFTDLSQASPSSITSTSGDIDVTIPESATGTFKMSTVSGGVYTAFDFDFGEETKLRRTMGQNATGNLNGGGVEVVLRSVSGNIYIRKPE